MDTRKILENFNYKILEIHPKIFLKKFPNFFPQIFVIIKQSVSILPKRNGYKFPVRRPF